MALPVCLHTHLLLDMWVISSVHCYRQSCYERSRTKNKFNFSHCLSFLVKSTKIDLEFGGPNLGRLNGSKETNQVKERDDDTLIHNNIYWTDSFST